MKRTITQLFCAAVVAFGVTTTAMAQSAYFSYDGKRLADGATITIEAEVTDPDWPDELECATNPASKGMNGLLLVNTTGKALSGKATLTINKNNIKPYRVQWCMGGSCQIVSSTTFNKDYSVPANGRIPIDYDAALDEDSQYGEMETTIVAKAGTETFTVKVVFTYTDPALVHVSSVNTQKPVVLEYFTLDGKSCKLQQPKGVSLARFSDGKVRKVIKK